MNSHHATIVGRENLGSGGFIIIGHEKLEGQGSNSNENESHNDDRDMLRKLFKNTAAHMQNVDELRVTGAGKAQEQFIKYLSETAQYKNGVTTESTSIKMSDQAVLVYVTTQFNPLGVIIKNVSSSVFCVMKWNKKSIEHRF